uniref:Nucleotide-diphospho-sugar transferase domain-containing protein n=1 Tax=Setaria italica TaxID=4555 RepID=K3ZMQ5_SETIT
MDDKTVIMTFTNEAWAAPGSLQDLFLSFRLGIRTAPLLKHLIIIAVDTKAYKQCQRAHSLCYHLRVEEDGAVYTAEQAYMSKGYLEMMWRRNRFQVQDIDIICLRNQLLRIPIGADIAMSCDRYPGDNPYDLNKEANTGFVYVKASARMVAFYESWYAARGSYPGTKEQDVLEQVKHVLPAQHGLLVQFMDTAYLTGFCELSKNFNKVCTLHGNCLPGLKMKLGKLTEVLEEWKQLKEKAGPLESNTLRLRIERLL